MHGIPVQANWEVGVHLFNKAMASSDDRINLLKQALFRHHNLMASLMLAIAWSDDVEALISLRQPIENSPFDYGVAHYVILAYVDIKLLVLFNRQLKSASDTSVPEYVETQTRREVHCMSAITYLGSALKLQQQTLEQTKAALHSIYDTIDDFITTCFDKALFDGAKTVEDLYNQLVGYVNQNSMQNSMRNVIDIRAQPPGTLPRFGPGLVERAQQQISAFAAAKLSEFKL